ncbi:hypothetical protein L208DRAFT_1412066, partial [Tricholoma matsutake]
MADKSMAGGKNEHSTRDDGNDREHKGDRTAGTPQIHHHQWTTTMMHGSLSSFGP